MGRPVGLFGLVGYAGLACSLRGLVAVERAGEQVLCKPLHVSGWVWVVDCAHVPIFPLSCFHIHFPFMQAAAIPIFKLLQKSTGRDPVFQKRTVSMKPNKNDETIQGILNQGISVLTAAGLTEVRSMATQVLAKLVLESVERDIRGRMEGFNTAALVRAAAILLEAKAPAEVQLGAQLESSSSPATAGVLLEACEALKLAGWREILPGVFKKTEDGVSQLEALPDSPYELKGSTLRDKATHKIMKWKDL